MIGIGAFAFAGGVSVRTLRLYDDLGLLVPARVDDRTGYRSYRADQLPRLHRIVALKDLGFSLAEIAPLLDDEVNLDELRGMLRLRHAEANEQLRAAAERLRRVEARLALLEGHGMTYDMIIKSVEPITVAQIAGRASGFGDVLGPVFAELYGRLDVAMTAASVAPVGPAIALYDEDLSDRDQPVIPYAAMPVSGDAVIDAPDVEVVRLPAIERAVSTMHHGDMATLARAYEALMQWSESAGETIVGLSREIYHSCEGPQDGWVTEILLELGPSRDA